MKFIWIVIFLIPFAAKKSFAAESLSGKWRGAIIGHVDNRNYFINADLTEKKKSGEYIMKMKLFSDDYNGEFLLQLNLVEGEKLFIKKMTKVSEFPYPYLHIEDCFTGYFLLKQNTANQIKMDLYRNAVYHKIEEFTNLDGDGNFVPGFECFTSVMLHPITTDTMHSILEKKADSMIVFKKYRADEVVRRKVVSSKECTVKKTKISLQVWDNNKEDGDIISLKLNNTWVLTNFKLKNEKYTIPIELKKKDNQLLLFAENLGSIPPNTAAISIDDGTTARTYILNSDMSKSEMVKITLADTKPVTPINK
jgi:hypothetical protein